METRTEMPLVTIGIPTYNRAKSGKLQKVIQRSLQQSYENIEVVVSDNCSSDNTTEVVNGFSDPRLRYFRQSSNIGPNNNFNFCLEQARGQYFLLFHDDDTIDEDFVESCISAIALNQTKGQAAGIVFTGVRVIDEHDQITEEHENKTRGLSGEDFVFAWFDGTVALFLCNTLYNTELLKACGGFGSKNNLYDDLVPTFKLVGQYDRVDVREIKAGFRRHSSNRGSSVPMKDWIDESCFLLDVLSDVFPAKKQQIQARGGRYFSRKHYRTSVKRAGVVRCWGDCLRAYKAFNFSYSPFSFMYEYSVRPKLRKYLPWVMGAKPLNNSTGKT